jgi:hypothetical protein
LTTTVRSWNRWMYESASTRACVLGMAASIIGVSRKVRDVGKRGRV